LIASAVWVAFDRRFSGLTPQPEAAISGNFRLLVKSFTEWS